MNVALNGRFLAARVTGVQRFAREISARLLEGDGITLFLPASVPLPPDLPAHARVVRGRLSGRVWEQAELPRLMRADRSDVGLSLGGSAPGWGGPHVVAVHDLTPLTHPDWYTPAFRAWFSLALGRSARRAAGVVAVSEWTRTEVERVLGVDPRRIRVVSQGLGPFDSPASAEAVRLVRERWGLPEGYLLGLGGRNPRKNAAFLLAVLARWRERHGDPPALVLVGEEFAHLHMRAELGNDSAAGVYHVGHVDDEDLRALYTGATVFCFPSLAEGFGRPPLEAMACGTPAVVADYPAAREVLGDAAAIRPLDRDGWIEAIIAVSADRLERARRVERGRERAAAYRWEVAAAQTLEACAAAIAPPGARA